MSTLHFSETMNFAQWIWPLPSDDVGDVGDVGSSPADISKAQQTLVSLAARRAGEVLRSPFYRPWGNVIKPVAVSSAFSLKEVPAEGDEKDQGDENANKDENNEKDDEDNEDNKESSAIAFPPGLELQLFLGQNPSRNGRSHSAEPLIGRCRGDKGMRIISGNLKAQILGTNSPWQPYSQPASLTFSKTSAASRDILNGRLKIQDPCTLTLGRYSWQFGFRGPLCPPDKLEDNGLAGPWGSEGDQTIVGNFFNTDYVTEMQQQDSSDLGMNSGQIGPPSSVSTFQLERSSSALEPFSSFDWAVYLSSSPSRSSPEKDVLNVHLSGGSTDSGISAVPRLAHLQESESEPSAEHKPALREAACHSESSTDLGNRVEEPASKKAKKGQTPSDTPSPAPNKTTSGGCVCVECGKRFDMPQALGGHMSTHRRSKGGRSGKAQQQTPQRHSTFTSFPERSPVRGQMSQALYQHSEIFRPGIGRTSGNSIGPPLLVPGLNPCPVTSSGVNPSGPTSRSTLTDSVQPFGQKSACQLPSTSHDNNRVSNGHVSNNYVTNYFSGAPVASESQSQSQPAFMYSPLVQRQFVTATVAHSAELNVAPKPVLRDASTHNRHSPVNHSPLAGKLIQFGGQLYRLRQVDPSQHFGV